MPPQASGSEPVKEFKDRSSAVSCRRPVWLAQAAGRLPLKLLFARTKVVSWGRAPSDVRHSSGSGPAKVCQ